MTSLDSSQDTSLYIQRAYNIRNKLPVYGEVLVRKYNNIDGAGNIIDYVKANKIEHKFDLDILRCAAELKSKNHIKIPISVNLMPQSIKIVGISEDINRIIIGYGISKSEIIIEITEKTDFCDEIVIENINKLRNYGFKIALDDFGVEKSNMISLLTNKFDSLKIDRSFVEFITHKKDEAILILKHIKSLCDAFNMSCCVEGVETEEQLELLNKINCDIIQGYIFEKPFPMDKLIGE